MAQRGELQSKDAVSIATGARWRTFLIFARRPWRGTILVLRIGNSAQIATFLALTFLSCGTVAYDLNDAKMPDREPACDSPIVGVSRNCALKANGTVWCWGVNVQGQLGDGTGRNSPTPVRVARLTNITQIASNGSHACARETDGTLWCWGAGGCVGDGTTETRLVPVQVAALGSNAVNVSVSAAGRSCARKTDGTLWCWGWDVGGQGFFGDGVPGDKLLPGQITALGNSVAQVSLGRYHICATKTDGTVWCWGRNTSGALGDGTTIDRPLPLQVVAMGTSVASVAAGVDATCAVKTDHTLWCWGAGVLGDGLFHPAPTGPTQVTALGSSVAEVSAEAPYTCARTLDGSAGCWGNNAYGELGDGTTQNRASPVYVAGLGTTVAQISAGDLGSPSSRWGFGPTSALKADGTVWAWGNNTGGGVGDGTTAGVPCGGGDRLCRLAPVKVIGLCQ